jgi:hypothetical protein
MRALCFAGFVYIFPAFFYAKGKRKREIREEEGRGRREREGAVQDEPLHGAQERGIRERGRPGGDGDERRRGRVQALCGRKGLLPGA